MNANEPVGHVVQWVDGSLTHAWCTEAPPVGTPLYTQPAELTDEEKIKLIRTLKWAEDLLRSSCNDEAVNDVQDCLMILKKVQEK